jgi:hypothetical protein
MYVGSRVSQRSFDGLEIFLETTAKYKKPKDMSVVHYICCPCIDCCNETKTSFVEEICEHLIIRGFMNGYTCWTEHGEYK